jgi:hypothetical protein
MVVCALEIHAPITTDMVKKIIAYVANQEPKRAASDRPIIRMPSRIFVSFSATNALMSRERGYSVERMRKKGST